MVEWSQRCQPKKIKIREITNFTIFDSKNLLQVEICQFNLKMHQMSKISSPKMPKIIQKWLKNVFYEFYSYCPGDLVTCTGEWKTGSVSRRFLDNLGELT